MHTKKKSQFQKIILQILEYFLFCSKSYSILCKHSLLSIITMFTMNNNYWTKTVFTKFLLTHLHSMKTIIIYVEQYARYAQKESYHPSNLPFS